MRLQWFTRAYLTADPRGLAAGRIALASVLLLDLGRRAMEMRLWYTNSGLLPNHTVLWSPSFEYTFSFFFMCSRLHEAAIGFLLCFAAYGCLLIGLYTRVAQVLSVIAVLSLHGRVLFAQSGGDVALVELAIWTAFLPTGRRYSVDSLRRSLRQTRESTLAELNDRSASVPETRAVVSLSVLALTLQLGVIYFFNAIQKSGTTWREGSVVHYMLHQDEIVTTLGVWLRERLTLGESRWLTYSALGIEAVLPLAVLLPVAQVPARRVAVALLALLHAGFALLLNLGIFVPTMLAFAPNLLRAADWDAIERRLRPRKRRLVECDARSALAFGIARLLARLDAAGRLEFVEPQEDTASARTSDELVAIDPVSLRRFERARAWAEIAECLPFGVLAAVLLRTPGLRNLAGACYEMAAKRAPATPLDFVERRRRSSERPASRGVPIAREASVALLMLVASSQLLVDNPRVTHVDYAAQPKWMAATASYLQFLQAWSMYAPDAPTTDANLYVDAITAGGRHVDPFNEVASPNQPRPGPSIPPRLGQSLLVSNYVYRIPYQSDYFPALREWILRYSERTGRPEDRIVSFAAYSVIDESPPPGERLPRHARAQLLFDYDAGASR